MMTPKTTPRPRPAPRQRLGEREAVGVVLDHHAAGRGGAPGRRAGRARSGRWCCEFFISPVRLDTAPGVPTPIVAHSGASRAQRLDQAAVVSTMCS